MNSCSVCQSPNATFKCHCCVQVYCNKHVGAGMRGEDKRDFLKIENEEQLQRRELEFKLTTIRGPHTLLYFKYAGSQFYLFGEDHERQPKSNALDIEMDIKYGRHIKMTNKPNNSKKEMTIERFFLALFSDPARLRKEIYLEIMPKAENFKPKRAIVYKGGHLEKLYHLFRESLEYDNNTIPNQRNIGIHPVDFRMGNAEFGIGSRTPPYMSFFSLFYQLFKQKKREFYEYLFETETNPNWDMELLDLTLFGKNVKDQEGYTFEDYYFKFRRRFDSLFHRHGNDEDLKYFNALPAMQSMNLSFNKQGISKQSEIFLQLPENIQHDIYLICHAKVRHVDIYAQSRAQTTELYGQMDNWYTDIPAMATMMLQAQPGAIAFGYFGSDHITHMASMAARVDPFFEMWTDSMNGIELPVNAEKTFNALIKNI